MSEVYPDTGGNHLPPYVQVYLQQSTGLLLNHGAGKIIRAQVVNARENAEGYAEINEPDVAAVFQRIVDEDEGPWSGAELPLTIWVDDGSYGQAGSHNLVKVDTEGEVDHRTIIELFRVLEDGTVQVHEDFQPGFVFEGLLSEDMIGCAKSLVDIQKQIGWQPSVMKYHDLLLRPTDLSDEDSDSEISE